MTNDPSRIMKGEEKMMEAEEKDGVAQVAHINKVKSDMTAQ